MAPLTGEEAAAFRRTLATVGSVLIAYVGLVHEVVGARLYPDGPSLFGGPFGWYGAGLLLTVLGLVMTAGALGVITVPLVLLATIVIAAGAANVVVDALLHGGFHFFAFTLVVAGAVVAASAARWPDVRNWGSTAAERQLVFPCDRHLPNHDDALYRAIDVEAPGPLLFRWLCQLRAAPYSYDWIDNFGRPSPRRLTPGLDALEVGQRAMGFELVAFERNRHLTLCGSALGRAFGAYAVTYLVLPSAAQRCRLVVKLLVAYPRPALLRLPIRQLGPLADLIMMRKQLLTLKSLAERDATVAAGT